MGVWKREPRKAPVRGAAVAVAREQMMAGGSHRGRDEGWQYEADIYDEYGPGFVGSYLDLVSHRVGKCDALLAEQASGQRVAVDDDTLNAVFDGVWRTFRGRYEGRQALLRRLARLRLKAGEAWVFKLPDGKYQICHRRQLQWAGDYILWTDPMTNLPTRQPLIGTGIVPSVWRSWSPSDVDPACAYSDMKRALPHIREYINVKLRQDSDTTSPLVRNKIMVFDQDSQPYDNKGNDDDPLSGMPDAYVDFLNIGAKNDRRPYHAPRRSADSLPFPMLGVKPDVIDLGRNTDPQSAVLEDSALSAFARSVRVPAQYILSGPGVAKFENEDFVAEDLIVSAIQPTSEDVLDDLWRVMVGPLFIQALSTIRRISISESAMIASRLCMMPDLDRVRPKINRVEQLLKVREYGGCSLDAITDAADCAPMERPEGVSDYDMWRLGATPGAAQAAITRVEAGVQVPAAIEHAQALAAQDNVQLPPALRAAVVSRTVVDDMLAEAERVDARLAATLRATLQAEYRRWLDEAARDATRATPNGSDLRKRINAAPNAGEKLGVLTESDRTELGLTPEKLVPDSHGHRLREIAHDVIVAELLLFYRKANDRGLTDYKPEEIRARAAAAADRLSAESLGYARVRVQGDPKVGAEVPNVYVRNAMAVAGGADPATDGPSQSVGAANGPATALSLQSRGVRTTYRWKHGYFGEPMVPDPEHLALDGSDRHIGLGDTPIWLAAAVGPYPGDHPNCTCAWALVEEVAK